MLVGGMIAWTARPLVKMLGLLGSTKNRRVRKMRSLPLAVGSDQRRTFDALPWADASGGWLWRTLDASQANQEETRPAERSRAVPGRAEALAKFINTGEYIEVKVSYYVQWRSNICTDSRVEPFGVKQLR
jgi:hypothetical protein